MSTEYPRFCGAPDAMIEEARWMRVGSTPENPLLWTLMGSLKGISDEDFQRTGEEIFAEIGGAARFYAQYTTTARSAHIRVYTGPIDIKGGTLAWSELANGADTPLKQMIDTKDDWALFEGTRAGYTDLYRTWLHEMLHALGFSHQPNGSGSILEPYYSPTVRHLTAYDVRMLQKAYGLPLPKPTPKPDPAPVPPAGSPYTAEQAMAALMAVCERYRAGL